MPTDASVIRVRGLSKTYGGLFKKGFRALDSVDLEVGRGTVFGLLGPNGAGKTTLIKILLGLVVRWEGEATLFGQRAGDPRSRQRAGFLPEAHRLPPYLTGRQVLLLYGMLAGRDKGWLAQRAGPWLERVGMAKDADRKVREYSKGMQQRIGLVQALLHEPEVVFLDEPTDGVDPIGRAAIREIVQELAQKGVTVFINSHLLMEVEMICDRVVIMQRGRIVREGRIEELTGLTGRVHFELRGVGGSPASGVATALGGIGADLNVDDRGAELTLSDTEQDAAIDRLRAAGICIRSITPRKLSLEEAFIHTVREDRA